MYTQKDVDDLTMQIKVVCHPPSGHNLTWPQDPGRVRGSGFIQFPPQRPFAGPVVVQPPTVCVSIDAWLRYNHDLTPKKQTWQQTERVTAGPQPQDLKESSTPRRKLSLTNVSTSQINELNQPEVSHKKVHQSILFRKTKLIQSTKPNSLSHTVTETVGEHISDKKLSKSQAKRLRKKKRDA